MFHYLEPLEAGWELAYREACRDGLGGSARIEESSDPHADPPHLHVLAFPPSVWDSDAADVTIGEIERVAADAPAPPWVLAAACGPSDLAPAADEVTSRFVQRGGGVRCYVYFPAEPRELRQNMLEVLALAGRVFLEIVVEANALNDEYGSEEAIHRNSGEEGRWMGGI
jgi:hypothetical protein